MRPIYDDTSVESLILAFVVNSKDPSLTIPRLSRELGRALELDEESDAIERGARELVCRKLLYCHGAFIGPIPASLPFGAPGARQRSDRFRPDVSTPESQPDLPAADLATMLKNKKPFKN
jgi:hypothetical protein